MAFQELHEYLVLHFLREMSDVQLLTGDVGAISGKRGMDNIVWELTVAFSLEVHFDYVRWVFSLDDPQEERQAPVVVLSVH